MNRSKAANFHSGYSPPRGGEGMGEGTHANPGQATGTRAWNSRARLSNPSTIVLARTNRHLALGYRPANGLLPCESAVLTSS